MSPGGVLEADRPTGQAGLASQARTLSVVIPALDEEDGIAEIVQRIESTRPALLADGVEDLEIIVVDDGSTDATARIVAGFETVRLIRHETNRGYGAAIKTGFAAARGELLAFLDADGTYPPDRLPALARLALDGEHDVVVGSRRSGAASQMPLLRRVGNVLWSSLVSVIGNQRVADPASGMRVLRRSALERLLPLPDGLNFTPVMSTRSVHEGLRVAEVPIAYRERVGRSKLSVVRDGTRFLATILGTALEYSPARVFGLIGLGAVGLAGLIGLVFLMLRLQGVSQLDAWGVAALFAALVLAVGGVSTWCLGVTFHHLVAVFRRDSGLAGPAEQPTLAARLERHLGGLGVASALAGLGTGALTLALTLAGWELARLWFWLVVSALLLLVGVQLIVSWVEVRVLQRVSSRASEAAAREPGRFGQPSHALGGRS